ncbi:protein phosphatase methylesterase [Lasiosphaeris hirsuta]|uniref:Protein phosphatase methylesterase 1 n=1 Tax=Lasiosphaeris hirsuta TaxID=260670 RepID=A0AA40EBW7_9PEZI|nr:protein phosphatase methylesterase [Lasiosphaeris hirsuta]
MSDLQKRWAKAKINAMAEFNELDEEEEAQSPAPGPTLPGGFAGHGTFAFMAELAENPHHDDDSSSASSSSVSSTGTVIPSPGRALFARPQDVPGGGRSLDPIPWTTYFERELFLPSASDAGLTHHAYLTSPVGKGPLFVTHHGAGSSGLSFALLSAEIRKRLPTAGILSPDARGHGATATAAEDAVDLSLPTLAADLAGVIRLAARQMGWDGLPPVVLVGHSLGGAVVTDVAMSGALGPALLGYAVLDVVEGSAMDALQSMHKYLSTRPVGFATLRDGIDWHVRSRTVRSSVSARTSVPGLLVEKGEAGPRLWRWRTDLAATQSFWEGWFVGLSKKFLGAKGGKLLLLAGTDRLDTELTIGQMQGKYALQVFPEAGHFIHEDLPEKTAISLVDFYRRNDRSALVLPPKVSELLAQGKRV